MKSKIINKLFQIDIKSIDEVNRKVTFCFSDDSVDRQGEIVDQSSWKTDRYLSNPLILWGHDPDDPENVLGQGSDLQLNVNGKSFITAQFDEAEINPRADMIFRQLVKRTLRTVSAGFIPHTVEYEDDIPVLKDCELLEVSVVAIPANANAVALSYKSGDISQKDATWMIKSMREEADRIEAELKTKEVGEPQVEELKQSITELTDLVGKIGTSLAEVTTELTAIKEAQAAPVETEEEKTAREAQEAIDAQVEIDRIAAEEAAANGGDIDHSGAEDETELDLDADLTDEQLAEAEAAIALELEAVVA